MTGGIYLWKDGREVPDTMNVSMEHEEEILFTWDSGFGNDQLGRHRRRARHDGTISHTPQQHQVLPAEGEPQGRQRNDRRHAQRPATRTCRTSSIAIRSGKRAELPVRRRLPRLHRLPHGRGELPPEAHRALGPGERRDRLEPQHTPMDFEYTPEQLQLRKAVREFAEAEIAPHVMEWDEAQTFPARSRPQARQARLHGRHLPGGSGRRRARLHRVLHHHRGTLARGWLGRASSWPRTPRCAPTTFTRWAATSSGAATFPNWPSGEWIGCWSLTEPEAGSDAAGTRTHAELEDGVLGAQRRQDVHHQRALRRRLRRHGGHRPRRRAARHLRLHHRKGHARVSAAARRKTSSACAPAPPAK